jgi:DNA-binding transcriptional ArsR family regulator
MIMDDRKAYYAIIPASVRYDNRLKANEKLLYGEITALCNEKGYCWATNQYFAELYGVSRQTVSGWVSNLKNCGYVSLEIAYKGGTREIENRYIRIHEDPIKEKPNTPIREKPKDNSTGMNTTPNNTTDILVRFSEFWERYPKKRSKGQAEKVWEKLKPDNTLFDKMVKAIGIAKTTEEWTKKGGQFIPYPATWLNGKGWEDEIAGAKEDDYYDKL